MKAVVCTKYGPPDGLQLQEVEKPRPKNHEVLIKIHATTVTSGDVIVRKLWFPIRWLMRLVFRIGKNELMGHELAGVIEAVGKEVKLFKPGDQVFASTGMGGGAYAEYICLPESKMLTIKPTNLDYAEAAAVPVGAITALSILRKGKIQDGQKVLVYGASGSVGTYAVQLAKNFGAEVTGVCSTSNLELVSSLGADKVIDYTKTDFTMGSQSYDLIFNAVGKISSAKAKKAVKKGGTYVSTSTLVKERKEDLVFLKELIEEGKIRAVIDRRYPLEEIVEAHRYVDKGHKKGNVVITLEQNAQL